VAKTFTLEIVTPERAVFAGPVTQLIVPCLEGYLGVLAGHAPFLGVLEPGEIVLDADGKRRYLATAGGFVEVTPRSTMILSEAVERVEEINEERAQKARARALERLGQRPEGTDVERARRALRRADNRLGELRRRRP
jgi:F-type H+-transporting ATPase subunit epsilon